MFTLGRVRKQWVVISPLTTGETRTVPAGGELSGITFHNCLDAPWFRFSILSSDDCTVTIRGALDETFTDVVELGPFTATGGTPLTAVDLPSPYSGNNGWLTLHMPFIRLILADAATANHTSTILFAEAMG